MKYIGIIGSRKRNTDNDFFLLKNRFEGLLNLYKNDLITIVSGGCYDGGDKFAEILAEEYNIPILIFYPDKSKINKELSKINYRAAYREIAYARNELIAEKSDILIALVTLDRKGGTENTIKHFINTFKKQKENLILI